MNENGYPPAIQPQIYDESWCDEMGGLGSNEIFVESKGQVIRPRLAHALDLSAIQPGTSILDIGCGRGELLIKAYQMGASLAAGVDYAPVPLRSTQSNIEAMGLRVNSEGSPLTLNTADVKVLPFRDESFDYVFMLDVVEHVYEWELQLAWREIKRVLKPNGLLIIHTLPNRWAMDYGYRLARLFVPNLPRTVADKRDIFHINEQSVLSLSRSLKKGGLKARVWLEDQMLAQADWLEQTRVVGEEAQIRIYKTLQRPLWRKLYRLAVGLPSRLLIVTDLFAVAWKSEEPPEALNRLPRAYTERVVSLFNF